MLIASKLVVNESKQDIKLLIKNLMLLLAKPLYQSAGKLKPQEKLRKKPYIKNKAKYSGSIKTATLDKSGIKTENLHNHLV